jgi:hypothetical protein
MPPAELRPWPRRLLEGAFTLAIGLATTFIVLATGQSALVAVGIAFVLCVLFIVAVAVWELRVHPKRQRERAGQPSPASLSEADVQNMQWAQDQQGRMVRDGLDALARGRQLLDVPAPEAQRSEPKPLSPRHEADIRGAIDNLFKRPEQMTWQERMALHDLQMHQRERELWALRDELFALNAEAERAYKAYADQLSTELDRLGFGEYRRWVEDIAGQRTHIYVAAEYPPWDWNCSSLAGGVDIRLNNYPIARITTIESALSAYERIMQLWRAIPTWRTTQELRQQNTRPAHLKQLIEIEEADLRLTDFAGTGPCDHC